MRAALYARVSTFDQEPENQLQEIRRYIEARGWKAVEYVDRGISGGKDRRPALDQMIADAKRRKFDVVVCWRLDRLGRNLKHLVTLLDELQALSVAFVSMGEGIDCTTPAGKLQLHILAALAEFERGRIAERVRAGLARVRAQGKRLGRPVASCRRIGSRPWRIYRRLRRRASSGVRCRRPSAGGRRSNKPPRMPTRFRPGFMASRAHDRSAHQTCVF